MLDLGTTANCVGGGGGAAINGGGLCVGVA